MTKSLRELQTLWKKEMKEYKKQELGTGVQGFVKKIFKSTDIFNLKEGRLIE